MSYPPPTPFRGPGWPQDPPRPTRPTPDDYRRPQGLVPESVVAPPGFQDVNNAIGILHRESWKLGSDLPGKVGG
jgi:hypothetical protein